MKITITHLTKMIKKACVLNDVSMELESGKIYGFQGENGSGKTMLFRALSGLMGVDSGTVEWEGKILRRDFQVLPDLGLIIENVSLYPGLTGVQNLAYLAALTKKVGSEEIRRAILRVGLDPDDKRTYRKYSMGMKQRLAIAQAIMEAPAVIMLDEPTNGLDESGVELVRKLILEEKERGALILLASHSREDIKLLSDVCFRIEEGSIREGGDV